MAIKIMEEANEFAKNIVEQVEKLAYLSDDDINNLAENLKKIETSKLRERSEIITMTKKIGISRDIMFKSFPALLTIYVNAIESDKKFEEELHDISEDLLTKDKEDRIKLFFTKVKPVLKALWEEIRSKRLRPFPIDEFMAIRTRIINVAQFEKEFSAKDNVDEYSALVERYHARALFTFRIGEENKEFTFYASEDDLDYMIKWLNFSKKQLKAVLNSNSE